MVSFQPKGNCKLPLILIQDWDVYLLAGSHFYSLPHFRGMTAFSFLNNVDCVCVCASLSGNSTCWDENDLYCGRQGWGLCNTDRCGVVASCRGWWEETAVRARGKERGIPILSASWRTACLLQNSTLSPLPFSTPLLFHLQFHLTVSSLFNWSHLILSFSICQILS